MLITKISLAVHCTFEECIISSNLIWVNTTFSFCKSLLTELSKPCTLSHTNMQENTQRRENKEVSRWMSDTNYGITYNYYQPLGFSKEPQISIGSTCQLPRGSLMQLLAKTTPRTPICFHKNKGVLYLPPLPLSLCSLLPLLPYRIQL